jgi:hypothetical protein
LVVLFAAAAGDGDDGDRFGAAPAFVVPDAVTGLVSTLSLFEGSAFAGATRSAA